MERTLKINLIFLHGLILLSLGCGSLESKLPYAQSYTVVEKKEQELPSGNRSFNTFWVVSNVSKCDEIAQTAMKAAYELSKEYGADLTEVVLIPDSILVRTGYYYSRAQYASDNKGAHGISGLDPGYYNKGKWLVKSSDKLLSEHQLEILTLWHLNIHRYPSQQVYSSLSYDKESLMQYVAGELDTNTSSISLPDINTKPYKLNNIKEYMYPVP